MDPRSKVKLYTRLLRTAEAELRMAYFHPEDFEWDPNRFDEVPDRPYADWVYTWSRRELQEYLEDRDFSVSGYESIEELQEEVREDFKRMGDVDGGGRTAEAEAELRNASQYGPNYQQATDLLQQLETLIYQQRGNGGMINEWEDAADCLARLGQVLRDYGYQLDRR